MKLITRNNLIEMLISLWFRRELRDAKQIRKIFTLYKPRLKKKISEARRFLQKILLIVNNSK